jgi:origin recognition complex subunit 4
MSVKVRDGLAGKNLEDDSADELSADPVGTPTKATGAKRLFRSKAATAASPAPKSILTPSKKRNQTPKSVKFNKETSTEVFFDDLPKSAGPKKTSKASVNEILCGLCAKGHSRAPNQIILCDNCDYAVHQECYGVQEIPEGDWLCKSCSQEDVLKIQPPKQQEELSVTSAPVAVMASEAPDIPNLEVHLQAYQRVLLDRCTGRRRIEIFGLQEVREKAYQLMEQTVAAGEGNSMLLIGARGSGKTNVRVSPLHSVDFESINPLTTS